MLSHSDVHGPLGLVADPDWAMRALMRRSLEQAGYSVVECANSTQVNAALRTTSSRTALCFLLVTSAAMVLASRELLESLGRARADSARTRPLVLMTCEFGAIEGLPRLEFSDCAPVGLLEKPFDFALLRGIAARCRATPTTLIPARWGTLRSCLDRHARGILGSGCPQRVVRFGTRGLGDEWCQELELVVDESDHD